MTFWGSLRHWMRKSSSMETPGRPTILTLTVSLQGSRFVCLALICLGSATFMPVR